jgi:threonine aldolase
MSIQEVPVPEKSFASDNFAPAHPKVMAAILACNEGHAMAYGGDDLTKKAGEAFDRLFDRKVGCHFVFNGTGANLTALMAFSKSYGSVLCSDAAHIANDESTAPERLLGMRLTLIKSEHGKITADGLRAALGGAHGVHHPVPVALSITQPTELGTVYSLEELKTLTTIAHEHGLGVHMDGARLGCAVVSLGCTVQDIVEGVDILSFGGTKQGMICGEAVIVLKPGLAEEFPYWQKHAMQLASKMRFIAAQFIALLEDDLWLDNARAANRAAAALKEAVEPLPYVEIAHPVQANALFVRLPPDLIEPLQQETFFWPWDLSQGMVRWMCAFDSDGEDVGKFVTTLRRLAESRVAE